MCWTVELRIIHEDNLLGCTFGGRSLLRKACNTTIISKGGHFVHWEWNQLRECGEGGVRRYNVIMVFTCLSYLPRRHWNRLVVSWCIVPIWILSSFCRVSIFPFASVYFQVSAIVAVPCAQCCETFFIFSHCMCGLCFAVLHVQFAARAYYHDSHYSRSKCGLLIFGICMQPAQCLQGWQWEIVVPLFWRVVYLLLLKAGDVLTSSKLLKQEASQSWGHKKLAYGCIHKWPHGVFVSSHNFFSKSLIFAKDLIMLLPWIQYFRDAVGYFWVAPL